MKKTRILALLLVAVLVVATLCAGLTVSAADENVAKGKSYVVSQQFRQGGKEVDWGWDDNAPIAYPDDGAKLTDGIVAPDDAAYGDDVWAGFTNKAPEYEQLGYSYIRVDLGAEYDLSKLVLHVGTTFLSNGIGATGMTVSYYKVDDMKGANAELIGEATPADVEENTVASIDATVALSTPVTAQYVEIRLVRGGWMFISEFEAYGAKAGDSTGTESTPAGDSSAPADDSSAPADDSSAPADDSSAPADTSSTAPATSSTAPATSSTAPATSTTSKVPTGDAGMIGFAVLALVAIAGVAVAVKVRH